LTKVLVKVKAPPATNPDIDSCNGVVIDDAVVVEGSDDKVTDDDDPGDVLLTLDGISNPCSSFADSSAADADAALAV
jgi:hypothetical protein